MITVARLKKIIKNLPPEMKVGGVGHFGEFIEVDWVKTREVDMRSHSGNNANQNEIILWISIPDAGPEPE